MELSTNGWFHDDCNRLSIAFGKNQKPTCVCRLTWETDLQWIEMESLLIKYEKSYLDDNHKLIDFAKKSKVQNENIRNEKTKKERGITQYQFYL